MLDTLLSEKSEGERADILALRSIHFVPKYETVLDKDTIETSCEVLGDSGAVAFTKDVASYMKAVEAYKMTAIAKKKDGEGAADKKKVHKKKFGVKDHTLVLAMKYLPKDAKLSQETEIDTRWRVEYPPALFLPIATSRAYDEKIPGQKRAALMWCLKWAWEKAAMKTGEECPYELA